MPEIINKEEIIMRDNYESPKMEVVRLSAEDVIVTSTSGGGNETKDPDYI